MAEGKFSEAKLGSLPPRKPVQKSENPAHETLTSKCITVIAKNFSKLPVIDRVPAEYRRQLIEQLPLDVDVTVSAPHIHAESFWERCCTEHKGWKNCDIAAHGFTWKQLFFEQNLQEMLENFDPHQHSVEELQAQIISSKDYIFSLSIKQFLSHHDLTILFNHLTNFTRLELTYGVKRLRLRYDRSLFGMKLTDAESLSSCLAATKSLCSLSLPCNLLDDDLLEILIKGLKANRTITHLDLAHNKITDLGAQVISELLGKNSCLMSLSLADNQIHSEGGRLLGLALSGNEGLTDLNIRLNRLGDVGGSALLKNLCNNNSLMSLNLSSNSIGYEASTVLTDLLSLESSGLTSIDVSANDITEEDAEMILNAVRNNNRITLLDLRMNMVPKESKIYSAIDSLVKRNELDSRSLWGSK